MHASSLENMQKCYERYICGNFFNYKERFQVLDIGGANVNGSYRDIFSSEKFIYSAADIAPREGVDLVLDNPYKLPHEDESVDIVISGQTFEHVEFFWQLFEEISRVVSPVGWIILIAPSAGPIHRNPVDCYRFYPDAYYALARYTNIHVIDVYRDARGPWCDLVGVFSKARRERVPAPENWQPLRDYEKNLYLAERGPASTQVARGSDDMEITRGNPRYLDILRMLHEAARPSRYLEIGVRKGNSLALAECPAIAVDPEPEIDIEQFDNLSLYQMPSDNFFELQNDTGLERKPFGLVFIDGMHLFEFVLRDFINVESLATPDTVVVVDDIFPNHPLQASRIRQSKVWTGDVWKFLVCLKHTRPDLELTMLDTHPTGLLLIRRLNSANQKLLNQYNPLVRKYRALELNDYADLILNRGEALSVYDTRFKDILNALRTEKPRT